MPLTTLNNNESCALYQNHHKLQLAHFTRPQCVAYCSSIIMYTQSILYLPGLYSFDDTMLSIIPPVLPILKQPGLIPLTCNDRDVHTALLCTVFSYMCTDYINSDLQM